MNNMLNHLDTIRKVGTRLRDLANSRGVPSNIVQSLKSESDSVRWAHSELKKLFVTDTIVLIGQPDIQEHFKVSDVSEVGDHHVWMSFELDMVLLENFREKFHFDDKELSDDVPAWMICRKYYISQFGSNKIMLFECALLKQWLDEIGLREVRTEVGKWAIGVFNSM